MSTSQRRSSQRGTATALIIALVLALIPAISAAQGTLVPFVPQTFYDASGDPCSGCKLITYAAGTTTPQATYTVVALTPGQENANPVIMNAGGRPTTGYIFLSATSYKFVLTTSADVVLWTVDNVTSIPTTSGNIDITGTAGEALVVGDVVYLSDGSGSLTAGRWYKADADNTYSSTTAGSAGIVPTAIASGASGSIRLSGRMTGLSGLTAGEQYYVSATAGALTATPPTNARFVGAAESTTVLIVTPNPGGVRLPDSDGTHSLVIKTTSDLTADRLLTFVTGDAARTVTISGDATIGGDQPLNVVEGRLTLTTAVPVTTADVTAATTLRWALYKGSRIALYTGTTWVVVTVAELSIAVPATTVTMYDVFIDYTAGVPVLEVVAWTNDTTRAVALATQNGVYVQTSDADSRYVGSFRTTGVSGQTEDSFAKRYVWNYYNRVVRPMRVLEATDSWSYDGVLRQANGAAGNQLDFIVGVAEVMLFAQVTANASANTPRDAAVGIGLDSTSAIATGELSAFYTVDAIRMLFLASLTTYPSIGRHVAVWLEYASGATTTWLGDNGTPLTNQSGINGFMEM